MVKIRKTNSLISDYTDTLGANTTRYNTLRFLLLVNDECDLLKINEKKLIQLVRQWELKLSPSSITLRLRQLNGFYRYCIDKKVIKNSPVKYSIAPKHCNQSDKETLTKDELQKLLNSPAKCNWLGSRDRVLLALSVSCGYRVSTLATIKFSDFIQKPDGIYLNTWSKNGKVISKRIRDDVVSLLKAYESKTLLELNGRSKNV